MSGKSNLQRVLLALPFLVVPSLSFAADLNGANTAWILTATALVLFMTIPGLSLFYAGLVRSKNVLSVLMQCFTLTCLMSILWFVVGYTIAFGSLEEQGSFIGDFGNVLFADMSVDSMNGDIPAVLFAAFQMTFAVITPALIVGAFAERMKFSSMLLFSSAWLLLVYAPVCHWVWGGGWLAEMGFLDFAGGAVVHITAAVAALVAALVIGNRNGFPTTVMMPNNMTMTVTGAGMLWVGWFGFNAGSALAADGSAAMALLVTHISAAAGSLAWMTCEWVKHGKPSVLGIVTGMVAGLGTITPASGSVGPAAALVIGTCAGVICFFATLFIKQRLKIDDSLDVFPVHGVGGMLGTLLVGVFCATDLGVFSGLGFGGDNGSIAEQLKVQVIGIVATLGYTAVVSWIILKLVDALLGLRVTADEETEGLDIVLHEERGYDIR
ncbi:MAG: ammonia channel protein [Pseudomonadales bacterium]|jgi:ammonium transporter, Amt family|uniref:ammonium transporter n=1 Tax=unclassified Ketobacter TaxID=2639109 RepID=UPI000C5FB7E6|nr:MULTISPECIES: ammonium transporter [unclassified Ketobacter]MAQ24390.1 ammonia channel protein [Pseudomonadales bacterium]MEC8810772.1 ammonium transporter [Pseudomonadota bacterium]TNC90733.1 MAG: ammonia channel protein [Alcanivorax sp.]HAU15285.1 ammonia channel protein [Gammaproteobacteria bacterium]MBI26616.1 ammonia channel protein [Pseudomonadales bacterium]|tara:strand:- start:4449 stop:5762 length:1314 start_codon:yes stop_codon:yes gene_type:complete